MLRGGICDPRTPFPLPARRGQAEHACMHALPALPAFLFPPSRDRWREAARGFRGDRSRLVFAPLSRRGAGEEGDGRGGRGGVVELYTTWLQRVSHLWTALPALPALAPSVTAISSPGRAISPAGPAAQPVGILPLCGAVRPFA